MRKLQGIVRRLIRITCRASFCTTSSGLSGRLIVNHFVSVYIGIPSDFIKPGACHPPAKAI